MRCASLFLPARDITLHIGRAEDVPGGLKADAQAGVAFDDGVPLPVG